MHWWKSQKIKHNTENLNSILLCSSKASSELKMSVFLIYYGNAPREECEGAVKIRGKEAKQGCSLSPGSTENSFSLIPRWASEVWVMLQSHFSWLGVRVGLCFHIPTAVSYWLRVNWSGFGIPDTLVALHRWAKWLQQPEDSPLRKSFSCWSGGSDGKEYACNVGDSGSIPGSGRSSGEGNGNSNPLQYSCLEDSLDRSTWWAIVYGVAKSQTWLSN